MKLYASIYKGLMSEGKKVGKGDNDSLTVEVNFGNKLVGRLGIRYAEETGFTVYYYPVSNERGGRVLLHEEGAIIKKKLEKYELDPFKLRKGDKQKG